MGFDSSCKLLLGYNLHEISSLFSGGGRGVCVCVGGGGGGGGKEEKCHQFVVC